MKTRYFIIATIIGALAFSYHYFEKPKYIGDWENQGEEHKLSILENKIVIYTISFSKTSNLKDIVSYGDWSEIKKDEILIRYKLLNTDMVATFKTNSGNVGYFDNDFRTTLFTRVEN